MKTKTRISLHMNKELYDIIENKFGNKSSYIENIIYEDLLKKSKNEKIKDIII